MNQLTTLLPILANSMMISNLVYLYTIVLGPSKIVYNKYMGRSSNRLKSSEKPSPKWLDRKEGDGGVDKGEERRGTRSRGTEKCRNFEDYIKKNAFLLQLFTNCDPSYSSSLILFASHSPPPAEAGRRLLLPPLPRLPVSPHGERSLFPHGGTQTNTHSLLPLCVCSYLRIVFYVTKWQK